MGLVVWPPPPQSKILATPMVGGLGAEPQAPKARFLRFFFFLQKYSNSILRLFLVNFDLKDMSL